jgi:hypothetical protein
MVSSGETLTRGTSSSFGRLDGSVIRHQCSISHDRTPPPENMAVDGRYDLHGTHPLIAHQSARTAAYCQLLTTMQKSDGPEGRLSLLVSAQGAALPQSMAIHSINHGSEEPCFTLFRQTLESSAIGDSTNYEGASIKRIFR